MNKKPRVPTITRAGLKSKRGWTEALFKFLPRPDAEVKNPHYSSGPPMLLFNIDKIEKIEQSEKFKVAFQAASDRKNACKNSGIKGVNTKKKGLNDYIKAIEIEVPVIERHQLVLEACEHYNDMQAARDNFDTFENHKSDKIFLERICVNYLRHALTDYEYHLAEISGMVGVNEGHYLLKTKILYKIASLYKWLALECHRQINCS